MNNILIIGATSVIAEETAKQLAKYGKNFYLIARNQLRLSNIKADLMIRGAGSVKCKYLDVTDFESHEKVIHSAFDNFGNIDFTLIAHGTLPNQNACENDFNITYSAFNINAISTISLLTHIAKKIEIQKSGTLAVITSVAGDRGRQSNYVYGASKGMVSIFLQGMRNRLYDSKVNVIDIKPGFVDTPMTSELSKGILWAKPEKIAMGIINSVNKKNSVVYLPWFWKYIMILIRLIPDNLFVKMKF